MHKLLPKKYIAKPLLVFHCALAAAIVSSVVFMFLVEFKVEGVLEKIQKNESEISTYEDQIKMLEIEWVYLTRPERLRTLADKYLRDSGYTLASQVRSVGNFENYYLAKADIQSKNPMVKPVTFNALDQTESRIIKPLTP